MGLFATSRRTFHVLEAAHRPRLPLHWHFLATRQASGRREHRYVPPPYCLCAVRVLGLDKSPDWRPPAAYRPPFQTHNRATDRAFEHRHSITSPRACVRRRRRGGAGCSGARGGGGGGREEGRDAPAARTTHRAAPGCRGARGTCSKPQSLEYFILKSANLESLKASVLKASNPSSLKASKASKR